MTVTTIQKTIASKVVMNDRVKYRREQQSRPRRWLPHYVGSGFATRRVVLRTANQTGRCKKKQNDRDEKMIAYTMNDLYTTKRSLKQTTI